MTSLTLWRWVWANSGRQWMTLEPDMLQSTDLQSRTRLNNWTTTKVKMLRWPKLIYKFNAISMKTSIFFCKNRKKSILKFIWNLKQFQVEKQSHFFCLKHTIKLRLSQEYGTGIKTDAHGEAVMIGRVERSWTHALSRKDQNYDYVEATADENNLKTNRSSITKIYKVGTMTRQRVVSDTGYSPVPYLKWAINLGW